MGSINSLFALLCYFPNLGKNLRVFNSKKNLDNQWVVFLVGLNSQLLLLWRNSVNSSLTSLIDVVGLDLSRLNNYALFFNADQLSLSPSYFNRSIFYNCLDYKISARYVFVSFFNNKEVINSLEKVFSNSHWLERELVEFFSVNLTSRSDTRNLLLDYNFTANPLLKTYPTEGHQEIFFNHLSYNLEYVNAEFVEL